MDSIAHRVIGTYPLSIATSLALEGAMGVHPDRPVNPTLLWEYPELWVNIRTLFRNYYNAIGKDFYHKFSKESQRDNFTQEMELLKSTVQQLTNGKTKVVYFYSEYAGVQNMFKNALLRTDSTDNQVKFTKAMTEMLLPILRDDKTIEQTKLFIEQISSKALMITHYPIDLFVKSNRGLALLESHTGTIKQKINWYTKYNNGKTLVQIPFRLDFLTIFGDNEMFRPNLLPYRKALIGLAEKYNWNHLTTTDRIMLGIDLLQDKYVATKLKEMIIR